MPRFLALDPDAPGLLLLAGKLKKGAVQYENAVIGDEDLPKFSAATGGALGTALKELMKSAGVKPAPVLALLGRDKLILKEVKYPPCAPEDEPALVRNQVIRELTDTSDDVVMDYEPLGFAPDGQRRAQVLFVRKEFLLGLQALCEAAGLKLAGVSPRPFASLAALSAAIQKGIVPAPAEGNPRLAVAAISPRGGEFTIQQGRELTFCRSVLSFQQDQTLLAELKRNLTIYANQPNGGPLDTLYIPEAGRSGTRLADRLQDHLPVMVESFNLWQGTEFAEKIPVAWQGLFTTLAGLLELKRQNETLPINFCMPRQPRTDQGKKPFFALLGGLLALSLLLGLGGLGYFLVSQAESEFRAAQSEQAELDNQLKRYEPDMKRLEAIDEFHSRDVVWLDELYDLADRIPSVQNVKVVEFEGLAIPLPKPVRRAGVSSTPSAEAGTPPAMAGNTTTTAARPGATPKPPAVPIAKLRVLVRSAKPDDVQQFTDAMKTDKFYLNIQKKLQSDASGKGQVLTTVTADLTRRTPKDYNRALRVTPPAPPTTNTETADPFGFGGL